MTNKVQYDAGTLEVDNISQVIEPDMAIRHLLIYPKDDCFVTLNDSKKEIFIPKNMWTPISASSSFLCDKFTIKTATSCIAYWQGWVN